MYLPAFSIAAVATVLVAIGWSSRWGGTSFTGSMTNLRVVVVAPGTLAILCVFLAVERMQPAQLASELLPHVHRVISLSKRWLLGTHQESVDRTHVHLYLDENVFRLNRRRSTSRGLLFYRVFEQAVPMAQSSTRTL